MIFMIEEFMNYRCNVAKCPIGQLRVLSKIKIYNKEAKSKATHT